VIGVSIRLFNWRILKGETRGVEIRARELAAIFGRVPDVCGRLGRSPAICCIERMASMGMPTLRLLSKRRRVFRLRLSIRSSHRASGTKPPVLELHSQFVSLLRRHAPAATGKVVAKRVHGGKVNEIVFDNDNKRGAMDAAMMLQLGEIVDDLTQLPHDEQTGGLVLRGTGVSFCAGLDLDLAKAALNSSEKGVLMSDYMTDVLNRIRDSSYVSVCVINGPAVGGGMELITATDYRLMIDSKRCKIQSVHARIGASPGWGGGTRLCHLLGRQKALRLLGASVALDAKQALAMGLVDGLIEAEPAGSGPSSALESAAHTGTAAALAFLEPWLSDTQSPRSVAGIKYTLAAANGQPSEEEMAVREGEVFYERWYGEDNVRALSKGK